MLAFLKKQYQHIAFLLILTVILLPWLILGEHALISVHDYLDSGFAYLKMFRDSNLWFNLTAKAPALENMPAVYFIWAHFGFHTLWYALLPTYWAHVLAIAMSVCFAYYCLRLCLNTLMPDYKDSLAIVGTSLLFCALPNFYGWSISVATIPLAFVCFLKLAQHDSTSLSKLAFALVLYPLISAFGTVGMFILVFWLLGGISISLKNKKIHWPIFIGLLALIIGYMIVDARLFYMRFILGEALNRLVFIPQEFILSQEIDLFFTYFRNYFTNGHYHGPSFHVKVISPIVMGTFLVSCVYMLGYRFKFKRSIEFFAKYFQHTRYLHVYFYTCLTLLFCIIIAALGTTDILGKIFSIILPPLQGLSFARLFLFARVLWYITFGMALCLWCYNFKRHDFLFFVPKVIMNNVVVTYCILIVMSLQFYFVLKQDHVFYSVLSKENYSYLFQSNTFTDPKNAKKPFMPLNNHQNASSYDYYAEPLFNTIKKNINYSNENTLAFILDPVILTYNGIRTPGGYLSVYPLAYMQRFRKLLEPEFEVNHKHRDYYDSWGGRMYLFNQGTPETGYTLRINSDAMRNDFNIKYIFSSVKIDNAANIGLTLHGHFAEKNIPYSIYVYLVD